MKKDSSRRSHRILVTLLLVVGTTLTPITIIALFANTQISDTGRYVQNVAPLSSNPAIQAYVADDVTNRLFAQVDVQTYVRDALPDRAQRLAAPVASALEGFVHETTLRVLESAQFQTLWKEANRIAHAQIVKVLTGTGKGIVNQDNKGMVTIDLSALVSQVLDRLRSSGIDLFSKLPIVKIGGQIPVFQSQDLYKARKAVGALDKIAFVLPFLVFGSFGGAVFLSRNRRKGFLAAALCFALGAAVLAIGLNFVRNIYLDAATSAEMPRDAAAAMYDTLVRFLHTSVRAVLSVSVIVVIAVFFAGPSALASKFRLSTRRAANALGRQSDANGWGWLGASSFVVRHKAKMRVITAVIAFATLFFWNRPTPSVIFWVAVATLAVLAIIEFFGREPLPDHIDLTEAERAAAPTPVTAR